MNKIAFLIINIEEYGKYKIFNKKEVQGDE